MSIAETVRADHQKLLGTLMEARGLDLTTPAGSDRMKHVLDMLASHMATEDTLLYPKLRQAALGNERLRKLLDVFDAEMMEVSRTVSEFVSQCEAGEACVHDLEYIINLLGGRIAKEENVLLPELDAIGINEY